MYAVTGVGGYVGAETARRLLEEVPADQLIVTSRNETALERWAAQGVHARRADYNDDDALVRAFQGAHALFMVSGMDVGPRRQRQHRNVVEAAVAAGVQRIVYTSFLGTEKPEVTSLEVTDHKLTEALIRESGMEYRFMRNSQYADAMAENQAVIAITSGQSIGNTGGGRVGFVARDDVAAVAAKLLLGQGEPNTGYDVTGPEALSYAEVGAMITELSGAPITIVDLSDEEMYAMWDGLGVPRGSDGDFSNSPVPWCSDGMVSFGRMVRNGQLSAVTDVVERFTGRKPKSLRELMLERMASWPPAPVAR